MKGAGEDHRTEGLPGSSQKDVRTEEYLNGERKGGAAKKGPACKKTLPNG